MKRLFLILFTAICFADLSSAQGVVINSGGSTTVDESAMLEVRSSTKGMLVPRMTDTERAAIVNPATGLLVYQTNGVAGFYFNSGTPAAPSWKKLGEQVKASFSASPSVNQAVPTQTLTKLNMGTEAYDESGSYDPSASEFTAPAAGLYHFDISARVQIPNTAAMEFQLKVNGTTQRYRQTVTSGVLVNEMLAMSTDLVLVAGDIVTVYFYCSTTATINNYLGSTIFSGHKVN